MTQSQDEDEHSIEMHLPLVRKIFEGSVDRASTLSVAREHATDDVIVTSARPRRKDIQIVPILVGSIKRDKEASFGALLAPCTFTPLRLSYPFPPLHALSPLSVYSHVAELLLPLPLFLST